MPFRERMKKAFGRNGETSSQSKENSRKNSSVYQPGEAMPKPKYRQPVDKEHKEKLESFSFFGDRIRKRSKDSQYSPMGSKIPSRNVSRAPSRTNSIGGATGKRTPFSRNQSHVGQLLESADDQGDTANVGGSRKPSKDFPGNHVHGAHNNHEMPLPAAVEMRLNGHGHGHTGHAHDHKPFTEAELSNAFKKSSLQVPAGV